MKDTEFAYAVARIRSNETKLLSKSRIDSLINSSGYEEAKKILAEAGYGDFVKKDEDAILSERLTDAFGLIYESAPDKTCLDFLIVKNDFHNIKAILKAMVTGAEPDGMMLFPSIVDPELLKTALREKDYSLLPQGFSEICENAYKIITETMDGQALDVFLDRECILMSIRLAEGSKDEFSLGLAQLMAALANIRIALRCLRTGKDESFMKEAFAACKMVDTSLLCDAVLEGENALCSYVKSAGFDRLSESIPMGYAAFEKVSDDILIEKIRHAKYQCLGISPLVAYYFATDAEIKTVRIILSCKKNGLSNDIIGERVRELYV